ncbi:unnamed protein product, partial [Adineta ricciae]
HDNRSKHRGPPLCNGQTQIERLRIWPIQSESVEQSLQRIGILHWAPDHPV